LVAAELACRNLWSRDCDVAVAGGVNALLLPQVYVNFSKARMLSPTGRVLTFDARADGFVRAEGAGAVILKRLDDALADGDRIYAVITAMAVNQDGYTPTLTVPSAEAQAKMLRQVCKDAGVAPEDVGYVEAHGTGTPVGDPIEASAIGSVFGIGRAPSNRLVVGSVKTNVGHLESGAGVCGLIKTALSVYHSEIPANPNFETVNPNIPLDRLNIDIAREHGPWRGNGRRRAVVNSFGFGGTNASAVVEEAPAIPAPIPSNGAAKRQWVVPLSAATATAMPAVAKRLADALETGDLSEVPLRDVVGTLSARRAHLVHRTGTARRADFGAHREIRTCG
jgi:acyl transferase domain-containing protein